MTAPKCCVCLACAAQQSDRGHRHAPFSLNAADENLLPRRDDQSRQGSKARLPWAVQEGNSPLRGRGVDCVGVAACVGSTREDGGHGGREMFRCPRTTGRRRPWCSGTRSETCCCRRCAGRDHPEGCQRHPDYRLPRRHVCRRCQMVIPFTNCYASSPRPTADVRSAHRPGHAVDQRQTAPVIRQTRSKLLRSSRWHCVGVLPGGRRALADRWRERRRRETMSA